MHVKPKNNNKFQNRLNYYMLRSFLRPKAPDGEGMHRVAKDLFNEPMYRDDEFEDVFYDLDDVDNGSEMSSQQNLCGRPIHPPDDDLSQCSFIEDVGEHGISPQKLGSDLSDKDSCDETNEQNKSPVKVVNRLTRASLKQLKYQNRKH